ncbi:hypothetical protein OHV08_29385 [Streptomyces canus]|uniref:hypothetical protein n=1 Tax=Streptomyces canus TaxID=58343 RepID=UPI00324B100A
MRRPKLDQRVAAAGGTKLPGDLHTESHFSALLDECTALLGHIEFIETHDGLTAAATVGKNSRVTYDPAFSAGREYTDDGPSRTASLLHEIMHVSTYERYVKPTDPQVLHDWLQATFESSSPKAATCTGTSPNASARSPACTAPRPRSSRSGSSGSDPSSPPEPERGLLSSALEALASWP